MSYERKSQTFSIAIFAASVGALLRWLLPWMRKRDKDASPINQRWW